MNDSLADTGLIALRFVHFASIMLLCGVALFPFYTGTALPPLRRDRTVLGITAFASALAWLVVEAIAISGDPHLSWALLSKVLTHTEFGHIWLWRMPLLAALLAVSCLPAARWRWIAPLTVLAVAMLAGIGHGAMGMGREAWLHLGNQAVHMLAASVWVGGLWPLWLCVRKPLNEPSLVRVLSRFSHAGLAAVTAIVASGGVNAWYLVGSLHAMMDSDYGRVLAAKICLVAVMAGLAAYNRLALLPRIGGQTNVRAVLLRTVATEQALALGIVALVAWLGTMTPPFGMRM